MFKKIKVVKIFLFGGYELRSSLTKKWKAKVKGKEVEVEARKLTIKDSFWLNSSFHRISKIAIVEEQVEEID